jgi:hypothetical protein
MMKLRVPGLLGTLATVFAVSSASAQPLGSSHLDRFGLSYRMGFNISAQFKNLGGFATLDPLTNPRNPLRTPNNDPYNYDNGYIYPDATPGAHPGFTWYYGYTAGTPQRPTDAPTDFDLFRSSSPARLASRNNDDDPQPGVELTYNRQMGVVGGAFWGLEAGFGFTDLAINDKRTLRGSVIRVADTFRTGNGAILNPPPFAGTFQGPPPNDPQGWPLVGLIPVATGRQTLAGAATIAGRRQFEAQIFSLRLGPYLDMPLNQRLTFSLSAGLVLLQVLSDFKFSETVTLDPTIVLADLPPEQHRGSGSKDDLLVGGYIAGNFSYAINENWKVFAGAQFQHAGEYSHTQSGKKAFLNLGESIFVPIGMSFSF